MLKAYEVVLSSYQTPYENIYATAYVSGSQAGVAVRRGNKV